MNTQTLKETSVNHDILTEIKERWSPRVFSNEPIPEPEFKRILEAGRWAPSSYNTQPWRIIYGFKGTEEYDRILNCLVPFNQGWAKHAAVLLLGCYKTTNEKGQKFSHAFHDLGLFMANATLQAQHSGIAVHQMAGVNAEEAKKEFNIPQDIEIGTAVALGYYGGNPDDLPQDLRKQELQQTRNRMKIEEFSFNGDIG